MKRIIILILIGLVFSQLLYGQRSRKKKSYAEVKFGQLDPQDAAIGDFFGFSTGRMIDSRLSWGLELNIFKSTFRKQTVIAEFDTAGIQFKEKQVELEFTTTIVPVFVVLAYDLPLGGRRSSNPFRFRASGAIGWEFTWNTERNFREDISRRRFFSGLGWRLSSGLGIKISEAGILFFDVVYNDANVTRSHDRNEAGLPIFQVMDVSGFGFFFGLNITVKNLF